jgi:hypothetical protein
MAPLWEANSDTVTDLADRFQHFKQSRIPGDSFCVKILSTPQAPGMLHGLPSHPPLAKSTN